MSTVLGGPLNTLLEAKIRPVFEGFGKSSYNGPDDPAKAQDDMIKKLAAAIAEAVAVEIQKYLNTQVKVVPGQVVVTAGGPTNQAGATTTPGALTAP